MGGIAAWQGKIQLEIFGHTGSVCNDGFGDKEAEVVCRMLGYNRFVLYTVDGYMYTCMYMHIIFGVGLGAILHFSNPIKVL